MSIQTYKNTKIYVIAPANTKSGGPELLHQLVYHLRNDLNLDAYIYYIPSEHPNPVHNEFKQYNVPFVREIEDKKENLLIAPEVINRINELKTYSTLRKIIWWLSVDNFYISYFIKYNKIFYAQHIFNIFIKRLFGKPLFNAENLIYKYLSYKKNRLDIRNIFNNIDFHLVQSTYAAKHLNKIGIPKEKILYLSDYLSKEFLKSQFEIKDKKDIIVYNPNKGFHFTKKIIKKAPHLNFIPLINMSKEQIINTLKLAKVYIDFGNHPGKDRLPREAAILGCCIITGKRGSAKYFEDLPIPKEFKFSDKKENIPHIISKIEECFENYEQKIKEFEYYRNYIKKEPTKFINDLKKIFTNK